MTGLLFGLHPVHVESVAWVAERKDLLCALFCLLSLHAYLGHVRMRMHTGPDSATSAGIFPDRRLMTSLLLFGLALMSKPMAVSLPVLFLIIDWYVSGRVTVPMLTGKIPFFVLSALDAGLTMYAQQEGRSVVSLVDLPLSTRLLVAARSVIGYIGNLAWPAELLPLYPYPLQPRLLSPRFFLPVAAVTAFTCACVAGVVKNRAVSALWCSFLVMLLPVIGIVQVGGQAMADRYLYLPGIPPFLGVGACAALLLANTERYRLPAGIARPSLFLLAALVCGVLAYATVKQVRLWRDGVTLWTFAVDRIAHLDPSEFLYNLVYHNRGIEYEVAGRLEEAERDFRTAIALHPSYANSHYSLAVVLFKQGRLDEAALSFEASAYFNPVDADAQYNRGVIYLQQGRTEEAVGALRKAEQLRPSDIDTLYTLGKAYFLLGRSAEAEQKLQAVISRQYTIKEVHLLLGDLYAQRGDRQRAIREYEATLMLDPRSDEVRRKLDALLAAPHASQRQ